MIFSNYLISGPQFESLAHFVLNPHDGKDLSEEEKYRLFNSNAIIFAKTDFIESIFSLLEKSPNRYILITHFSDYSIDERIFNYRPDCIKKWFAINATYQHESLIPIPLGLYPEVIGPLLHMNTWDESEPYNQTMWFSDNFEKLRMVEKQNITYCCWGNRKMAPSYNYDRNSIIPTLINNKLRVLHGTATTNKQNVIFESQCKWVISPPGNGIDCHRTWECLYLGCIPIVEKNFIFDTFNLPILQINDWNDLNNDILNSFDPSKYSLEKLNMDYWRNRILNDFNSL